MRFLDTNPILKKGKWPKTSLAFLLKIEREIGKKLPIAFKEYCIFIGCGYEQEIFGSEPEFEPLFDVLAPESWEEQEVQEAKEFMSKLGELYPERKGQTAFCFSSHHGYVRYWFFLDGDDDPQCFWCYDDWEVNEEGRFSEFLLEGMKEYSRLLRQARYFEGPGFGRRPNR